MRNLKELSTASNQIPVHGVRKLMNESEKFSDVIHLEVGEPNVNTPDYIRTEAVKAMENEITHYTPNAGLLSLRNSIKKHLHHKYELEVSEKEIAVTAGAVNALSISLMAIANKKEEVLIPDPSWPNYESILYMQGSVPVKYDLKPDNNFIPDFSQLETLVTNKTKAIMINSPNNPTGAVYSKETILALIQFAKRHNLYVISDEVYDEITFDNTHYCAKNFDNDGRVISIFSFSKSYAMTGWRVGYAIGSERVISAMTKLIEPVISCAPSFAQKAAETALIRSDEFLKEMRNIYLKRRDNVYKILNENEIKAYKPGGTFYMLIDISSTGLTSDDFAMSLLHEKNVAVGPGETFGTVTKKMIRISLATADSNLSEGVKRISDFINENQIEKIEK